MQSPMVRAALEALQPAPGYELVKAYIQREPDGSEHVRLLLDYGVGGVKVYRVPVDAALLAAAYSEPVEQPEEPEIEQPEEPEIEQPEEPEIEQPEEPEIEQPEEAEEVKTASRKPRK